MNRTTLIVIAIAAAVITALLFLIVIQYIRIVFLSKQLISTHRHVGDLSGLLTESKQLNTECLTMMESVVASAALGVNYCPDCIKKKVRHIRAYQAHNLN